VASSEPAARLVETALEFGVKLVVVRAQRRVGDLARIGDAPEPLKASAARPRLGCGQSL
jgi:hypothetical protein